MTDAGYCKNTFTCIGESQCGNHHDANSCCNDDGCTYQQYCEAENTNGRCVPAGIADTLQPQFGRRMCTVPSASEQINDTVTITSA